MQSYVEDWKERYSNIYAATRNMAGKGYQPVRNFSRVIKNQRHFGNETGAWLGTDSIWKCPNLTSFSLNRLYSLTTFLCKIHTFLIDIWHFSKVYKKGTNLFFFTWNEQWKIKDLSNLQEMSFTPVTKVLHSNERT